LFGQASGFFYFVIERHVIGRVVDSPADWSELQGNFVLNAYELAAFCFFFF